MSICPAVSLHGQLPFARVSCTIYKCTKHKDWC